MRHYPLLFLFLILLFSAGAQDRQNILLANEYYQNGENDKALTLYQELAKSKYNYQLIYENYTDILTGKNETKTAEKFLIKINKDFPNNIQFQVELAAFYYEQAQENKLEDYLVLIKEKSEANPYQLAILAQLFSVKQMNEQSVDFYQHARDLRNDPSAHALEMATLYRRLDKKPEMIEEYLNYASSSPGRLNYIKNLLQNYLQEDEQLDQLETVLINKIQQEPDNTLYAELMIWVQLQRKDFYGAFIQARAIDKRNQSDGDRTMDIARIALDNKDYENAAQTFSYVIKTYPYGRNSGEAKKLYLLAKEEELKNTFPINTTAVRLLTSEYYQLYLELDPQNTAFEALRNKALLHAFYLNEIDSAKHYMTLVIQKARANRQLIAECKLDLGDFYLLLDEPWESTLLYSQVEKAYKSHPLGYEAKLRNARLNYFTGKFERAKTHIDILKKNTTRDISNDALALGMLINDNTALDTTDQVMQEFASAELLMFQNKKQEAKRILLAMLEAYEFHAISDEIYWKLAQLEVEFGNPLQAIEHLDKILGSYAYDILADDAAFRKAEIYDFYLKDTEQAKTLYQQFLIDYPGSKYAAESRKRFRQLRGDVVN